jgi:hypothetical protein
MIQSLNSGPRLSNVRGSGASTSANTRPTEQPARAATPNIPRNEVKVPEPKSGERKLASRPSRPNSPLKESLKVLRRVVAGVSGFIFGAAGGIAVGGAAGFLVGGLPGALIGAAIGGTLGAIGGVVSAVIEPTALNATLGALVLPVGIAIQLAGNSGA